MKVWAEKTGINFQSLDISPIVSLLEKLLENEEMFVRQSTARALAVHYVKKGKTKEIEALLVHKDESVHGFAILGLMDSAYHKADITRQLPLLERIAQYGKHPEYDICDTEQALIALALHYQNKGDAESIARLKEKADKHFHPFIDGALEARCQ